ncbi:MAG: 3-deoxy-8-phosphooctulonate synthase [Candidatus Kapabacteria bacterium]|nr:3-deoxy-8-phosphooctulonate synthase [Candidatus Kapabacteria bacterium]
MSKDFFIIAGPCVVESKEMLMEVAEEVSKVCADLNIKYYFKSSYKKANRTSVNSFTGIGDELALGYIKEVGEKFNLETLTDVHTEQECDLVARYVDVLQIPAFLARQTDLLLAAGNTGKIVNIKKAQFMAPQDMAKAASKVASTGNDKIWLTERGTFFGYNNLVVDFRSLVIMKETGYPVVFDATHSVQQPSIGEQSGGQPEFIPALARAATAVGINGLFFETHPDPKNAKSDAATQLSLKNVRAFLENIMKIHNV